MSRRPRRTDNLIFAIGPNRLQNELLAEHLNNRAVGNCSPVLTPGRESSYHGPVVVLCDCFHVVDESDLVRYLSEQFPVGQNHLLILYNAGQGLCCCKINSCRICKVFPAGISLNTLVDEVKEVFSQNPGNVSLAAHPLTPREMEVINLIANGKDNKEIALGLNVSVNTVKKHLYHIFRKTDSASRLQVALWAANNFARKNQLVSVRK